MVLTKKLHIFIFVHIVVVLAIMTSLLVAWQAVERSLEQVKYARSIEQSSFMLQQYIFSEEASPINSHSKWLQVQEQLSQILSQTPFLNAAQKTYFNSIKSKNESLLILYRQLQRLSSQRNQDRINEHIKQRLMVQVKSILEDGQSLAALSEREIKATLQVQMSIIMFVLSIGLLVLVIGAQGLTKAFSKVLAKIQNGMLNLRRGRFGVIDDVQDEEDFVDFIRQFNQISEQLELATVKQDVLQEIIDERGEALKNIENIDPLTRVANRRALFERGQMEFNRATRHQSQLSILLLDCDWFDRINEQYGHEVGDNLLVHLCTICNEQVRDEDFIGRYDGEAFIIILPHCDKNDALEKAEAIRTAVLDHRYYKNKTRIALSVSIGIATKNRQHNSFEAMISEADEALAMAKCEGRNCVKAL